MGKAVLTIVHLINRVPAKSLSYFSPVDLLSKHYRDFPLKTGLKPRVFGCIVYVHVLSLGCYKLAPRAIKCAMVGYSQTQKGYKCFDPTGRKFFISADVTFNESLSYFQLPQLQPCISATKDECWAMDSPIYPHLSGDVEDLATSPHILRASQKDLDLVPNLAPVSDVADEVNLSSNDTEIDLDPGVELEGIFT